MIWARVFAVLAAVLLVFSVALVALTPTGFTLMQGLQEAGGTVPSWLQGHSPVWLWNWIETPFLVRPLWLIPAGLGLICAGAAATLNFGKPSPSRRKRS